MPRDIWDTLRAELERELGEGVTVDALTGAWNIVQRAGGHRHSVDDVLTARYALDHAGGATNVLDLGTGIGTVGLLVLWGLDPARRREAGFVPSRDAARLVCVEAQAISYRLLLANIAGNALAACVEPHHADLRDFTSPARFPLVTGSPPYFPLGTGVLPDDAQKAHARFELRGDVRDYARAALRHLEPGGVFVFCFPTPQRDRAIAAARDAGFTALRYRDVIPRDGLRPLFTLFACRVGADELVVDEPFVVRDAAGEVTSQMLDVRRGFGFGA